MERDRGTGHAGGGGRGSEGRRREDKYRDDRRREKGKRSLTSSKPTPSFTQPPVILERRPVSVKPAAHAVSTATSVDEAPLQTPASQPPASQAQTSETQKQSSSSTPLATKKPMRLMSDIGKVNYETLVKSLVDQPGYYAVGVLGKQGVGKSSILSAFCPSPSKAFAIQPPEFQLSGLHKTQGIDIYITPERIILLDTQPILSLSVLERALKHEAMVENLGPEVWLELHSLQLAILLFSICNVVLVVTDKEPDEMMLEFLRRVDMLRPWTQENPLAMAGGHHFAELVFVCNRCHEGDMTQSAYRRICENVISKLSFTEFGMSGAISMPRAMAMYSQVRDPGTGIIPNIFLLPQKSDEMVPETYEVLVRALRNLVFGFPRRPVKLSEKDWFKGLVKLWDVIQRSDLIRTYVKTLRRIREG
ncbi:uncharacterized protein VTP21DRAFT_7139 [Calcarisporiella thermophila]|uniref:uncharacterized protein n=1 Tax=Calcarisporiella thermophila TaxID=911321 RepID=UPI003742EB55